MKKAARHVSHHDVEHARSMPESDPAYTLLSDIFDVVPTSSWIFARIKANGTLFSACGPHADFKGLVDEHRLQRLKALRGPRIATTLVPLDDDASGITLIFGDAHTDFGILRILRKTDLGPFTSSEVSILTFALDAISDRLATHRLLSTLQPTKLKSLPKPDVIGGVPEGAFYVLNQDLEIILAQSVENQHSGVHGLPQSQMTVRLPLILEESVRELTANWSRELVNPPGVASPVSFLLVKTQPMLGAKELFIGVHIRRILPSNPLTAAASHFHISPREAQVLALILDGKHLDQIATQLHITSSTVQDHIKSMIDKTKSNNRSELIARVLGWEPSPTGS